MKRYSYLIALLLPSIAFGAPPQPIATGLMNPDSVAVGTDGRIFISCGGGYGKDGQEGGIYILEQGEVKPFAGGMNSPGDMVIFQQWLFVVDKSRVRRVDPKTGKVDIWADAKDFPELPSWLLGLAVDETGALYVSGLEKKGGGTIYRIALKPRAKGKEKLPFDKDARPVVSLVADSTKYPFLKSPTGLVSDSLFHLLVLDSTTCELNRLRLSDGNVEKVADGFEGAASLCFDPHGRLYIISPIQGKIWAIPRPGEKAVLVAEGLQNAAGLAYDAAHRQLLVCDKKAGTLVAFPAQVPGWEVDETPLPFETEVAFPKLTWTGWDSGADSGKITPLRPLVLTHPGDGTDRVFVSTQQGVIHTFPNDQNATATKVFLDIQSKVFYKDEENEQGMLGFAFHPKYKQNGEFYVFYGPVQKFCNTY